MDGGSADSMMRESDTVAATVPQAFDNKVLRM